MAVSVVLGGFSDVKLKPHSGTVSAFARPQGGDNFILELEQNQAKNYARAGDDLIIEFVDGQRLTIKDFFSQGIDYHNLVLESKGTKQFVDFSQAVNAQASQAGDGVDEAALSHYMIHSENPAVSVDGGTTKPAANIDYDNVVSSTDAGADPSGFSKFFSLKSLGAVAGGLGAIATVAEYAYSNNDKGGDDFVNPFDGMEMPEVQVPKDPHQNQDSDSENKQDAKDLQFFTAGYHLVETRIVESNTNKSFPIFYRPLPIGTIEDMSNIDAIPFLFSGEQSQGNNYNTIYARMHTVFNNGNVENAALAKGEKVQFSVNGEAWQDVTYNEDMMRWQLPDDFITSLNDLYWMDSRIVDQNGDFRQGASIVYKGSLNATQNPIAQIDYIQGKEKHNLAIDNPVSDAQQLNIGGSTIGAFDNGHKIQVRIDGGGWYDVDEANIVKDGINYTWHFDDLPTLISSSDNDTIVLQEGESDTIVYHLLDREDKTGGNGHDEIYNFKLGQWGQDDVDRIDIAALLIDYDGQASRYLSVVSSDDGKDTHLHIYRNGEGLSDASDGLPTLITLRDVQTTLADLLDHGQLIVT